MIVSGLTSHGFEGAIIDADARLSGEVNQDFKRQDFIQYWSNDGEFRLALYAETDTTTTIVRIKTTSDDYSEYRGTAYIEQGSFKKTAEILCWME